MKALKLLVMVLGPVLCSETAAAQQSSLLPAAPVPTPPETTSAPSVPAPTRIALGAKVCIEADGEVRSLVQSAFVKKAVPVTLLATCEAAEFVMTIPHYQQHSEKAAVKITKLLLFGGTGDNFQMDATVANRDGVIIFAKTVKRRDSKVAAQDLAKWFGEFVKTGKIK